MIKLGFIGCGSISHEHLSRLSRLEPGEIGIVAFSDVDLTQAHRLQEAARSQNLTAETSEAIFSDYREMIARTELDAVIICTPHIFHHEQVIHALNHNLDVLVEKPLAIDASSATEMVDVTEAAGKVLMIAYQWPYRPENRFAKRVIERGEIGEPQLVTGLLVQSWWELAAGTWRADPQLSGGGVFIDSGSHLVDLVLSLTGLEPVSVEALMERNGQPVELIASLSVNFSGGALGSLEVFGNAPPELDSEVRIWGSDGAIFLRGVPFIPDARVQAGSVLVQDVYGAIHLPGPRELPDGSDPDINFIRVIQGVEAPETSAIRGVQVAKLTELAYQAAGLR
ncbi:MAG: Gfo/Idh/MocA family protein [Candidatus Bipolaricaulia bacterium]